MLYETRAGLYLDARYAEQFQQSPWIIFANGDGERWCQPDGLILDPQRKKVVVTEIKLRHCSEAWFQLFDLYAPVVRHLFPGWRVAGVEVCRWFDPSTRVPAVPRMREDPVDALEGEFNVHIWCP